jgi:hypothetical protein
MLPGAVLCGSRPRPSYAFDAWPQRMTAPARS